MMMDGNGHRSRISLMVICTAGTNYLKRLRRQQHSSRVSQPFPSVAVVIVSALVRLVHRKHAVCTALATIDKKSPIHG